MTLRCRLPGDRILVGGMHRAVRRLPTLAPLPPELRARMPLLADEAGVLAVPFAAKPRADTEAAAPVPTSDMPQSGREAAAAAQARRTAGETLRNPPLLRDGAYSPTDRLPGGAPAHDLCLLLAFD